jgi:hypothetical protein
MLERIDIASVLRKFDNQIDEKTNEVKTIGIRFITADGRLREMYDARKNVRNNTAPIQQEARSKQKYHLKTYGVIKLFDDNAEEYRDVKVAHMVQYRPHNSTQWISIYH